MKEVDFAFIFLLLFCASPFCDVQWLVGPFFFVKLLYYIAYFVQKLHLFFLCFV